MAPISLIFSLWAIVALTFIAFRTVLQGTPWGLLFAYAFCILYASACTVIVRDGNSVAKQMRGFRLSRDQLIALSLLLIAAFFRFKGIDELSVWLDEDYQAYTATDPTMDIVKAAAYQQQPPLDYFFTALNLSLIGWTELGTRWTAACLSSLTVPAIYFLGARLHAYRPALAGASLLAATNPLLIQYSKEGRPYATSMFCFVLFMHQLLTFWRTPDKLNFLTVWAGGSFLLMSVGFQPPVIVLVVLLAGTLLLPAFHDSRRRKLALLLFAVASAGLTFLPIQLQIKEISIRFLNPQSAIAAVTSRDHLSGFYDRLKWFFVQTPLTAAVISLIAAGLLASLKRKAKRQRKFMPALTFLFGAILAAEYVAFYATINYSLWTRYLLTTLPLLFVNLSFVANPFTKRKIKNLMGGVLVVCAALSLRVPARAPDAPQEGWRELYDYIAQSKTGPSILMNFALSPIERWSPPTPASQKFYLTPKILESVTVPPQREPPSFTDYVVQTILQRNDFRTIYLVELDFKLEIPLSGLPWGVEYRQKKYPHLTLYEIPVPTGTPYHEYFTNVLRNYRKIVPPNAKTSSIDYILAKVAVENKDCSFRLGYELSSDATEETSQIFQFLNERHREICGTKGP